jgi:hypothetical protein
MKKMPEHHDANMQHEQRTLGRRGVRFDPKPLLSHNGGSQNV